MTEVYVLNERTLKTRMKAVAKTERIVNTLMLMTMALKTLERRGMLTKKSKR